MVFYKVLRKIWMIFNKFRFYACADNVWFDSISSQFSYKSISIGKSVFIGPRAWFSSTHGKIIIRDNVMFGPNVQIYGGNHIFNRVGKNLNENHKDADHVDQDVIIESDVWVGASAIILTGVIIGRGAVIGAGSVVTKSVPAYAVCAGNPCKVLKMRFSEEEIIEHEKALK